MTDQPLGIDLMIESTGGGSVRHVMDLHDALVRRGHDLRLIVSLLRAEPHVIDWLGGVPADRIIRTDLRRGPHPSDLPAAMRLRRAAGPQAARRVLHAHSSKAGLMARMIGDRYGATLFTPHAFRGMDPALRPTQARVLRLVDRILGGGHDRVIAVSRNEMDYAASLGLSKDRLRYIPNGLDVDAIAVQAGQPGPRDGLHVGFVGRMVGQKNPMGFIRAFALAHAQRPELHAVIVGAGPIEAELDAFVAANNLTAAVTRVGHANFISHIRDMDMMVHSSHYESLPYTLLEGCAAGLAVVSVRNAGSVEVFGADAALIDSPDDARGMADAILHLAGDPAALAQSRQRSLTAARRFSIDAMVDATEALYRQVLHPATGAAA